MSMAIARTSGTQRGARRFSAAWAIPTMLLSACGVNPEPLPGPAAEMSVRGSYQCMREATAIHPEPGALLDVERLTARLEELLVGVDREESSILLTLWYQPEGVNIRRSILHHDVAPEVADSVQKLVFASLRPAPPSPADWGVRLRVDARNRVALALEPREVCPPRPRNPRIDASMAEYFRTGVRVRRGSRERTVLVNVTVHPLGYVRDARIVRGDLGGGALERDLAEFLRQFSFHPASIDGVPVQGEITVPVRLRS